MKTPKLSLLALLLVFAPHMAAEDKGLQEILIDIEVENTFNRGIEVLNGPTCVTCSEQQRAAIYDFLVEERERHRERLRDGGFGLPGFGSERPFAPTRMFDFVLSVPPPPCDPGGGSPDLCAIKIGICASILREANSVCSSRARENREYVLCEQRATANYQSCLGWSVDGESTEDRTVRCRNAYQDDRGGCIAIYNGVMKSCLEGEQERYNACMGTCAD